MGATSTPRCASIHGRFPTTRYQGSKRKLAASIVEQLDQLEYATVLDAFGGTGAVSYALKCAGRQVVYNDVLAFNHQIGLALIQNDRVRLDEGFIGSVGMRRDGVSYGDFIERTFEGIYFTDEENRFLDVAVGNIRVLACPYQRALAWFALFQSAIIKRPYNLFHRSNLYMRLADVDRSFGNKTTWDRSFEAHFRQFADEANEAIVDTGVRCRSLCGNALDVDPDFDLVYIDPPYINRRGVGVPYRDFYHFLEGMMDYDGWPQGVDQRSKHRRLIRTPDPWSSVNTCPDMFRRMFRHFKSSILVVSYRSDGIPSIDQLREMLGEVKREVQVLRGHRYQYALSPTRSTREVLLIGTD